MTAFRLALGVLLWVLMTSGEEAVEAEGRIIASLAGALAGQEEIGFSRHHFQFTTP